MSDDDFSYVISAFANPDFSKYDDFYDSQIADLPMYVISQFKGTKKESSKYNMDAPNGLKEISAFFEKIDTALSWKKLVDPFNPDKAFPNVVLFDTGDDFNPLSIEENEQFGDLKLKNLNGQNAYSLSFNTAKMSQGQAYKFLMSQNGVRKIRFMTME